MYNKLNKLLKQSCYSANKVNIKILTDQKDSKVVDTIQKNYNNISISDLSDDFNTTNIIIMYYNGKLKQYDTKLIKFINEYVDKKKIFILIVSLEFDFDHIVKTINASSIDAISWHDSNGKKNNEYIVVIKKD